MTLRTPKSLLDEVIKAYEGVENERQKEILTSLIRHMFAFANDVSLTQNEWREGVSFLRSVGEICSESRDEFILLSDILGLSALIEIINDDPQGKATPGSLTGPFHVSGSPFVEIGETINLDYFPGQKSVMVSGRVLDVNGSPVPNALMDIWQTAPNQLYAVQDNQQSEFNLRGKQLTSENGNYAFKTARPVPYSVPTDGPCGKILEVRQSHGLRQIARTL